MNTEGYEELDIAFDGLEGRPTVEDVADGQIHHLAATYDVDTGEKTVYLDGEVIGTVEVVGEIVSGGGASALIGSSNGTEPFDGVIDEFAFWDRALSADEIAAHVASVQSGKNYFAGAGPVLQAGDADMDLDFDQLDLVQVLAGGKYLTGAAATWGQGDWNGAPGGTPGSPPAGDGVFNQLDVIAALSGDVYLEGKYAAIAQSKTYPEGVGDGQTSVVYNAQTGEVSVDAPAGTELTSINIESASGIFTGDAAENLGGSFDNDADGNIFKATFGSSFGPISFGNVAQPGLEPDFLRDDLTVVGSLAGGGALGDVDLIYVPVPEPCSIALLAIGMVGTFTVVRGSGRGSLRLRGCLL